VLLHPLCIVQNVEGIWISVNEWSSRVSDGWHTAGKESGEW
jgi:hypothetical protein